MYGHYVRCMHNGQNGLGVNPHSPTSPRGNYYTYYTIHIRLHTSLPLQILTYMYI